MANKKKDEKKIAASVSNIGNRGAVISSVTASNNLKNNDNRSTSTQTRKNVTKAYDSQAQLDKGAHAGFQSTWKQTSGDADLYWKSTHNADGSKKVVGDPSKSIVGKGNKEKVVAPEWQKRMNAGRKQTQARQDNKNAGLGTRDMDQRFSNPYLYVADVDPFPANTTYMQDKQAQLRTPNKQGVGIMPSLDDYVAANQATVDPFTDPFPVSNEFANKPFLSESDKKSNKEAFEAGSGSAAETLFARDAIDAIGNKIGVPDLFAQMMSFTPDWSNDGLLPAKTTSLDKTQQALNELDTLKADHNVGAKVGELAAKAVQYKGANELMNLIPWLAGAKMSAANKLGGSALAKIGVDSLADLAFTDLPIDTLPQVARNITAGKSAGEITKDAANNLLENYIWNLIFGGIFGAKDIANDVKGIGSKIDSKLNDEDLENIFENAFKVNASDGTSYQPSAPGRPRAPRGSASDVPAEYLELENEILRSSDNANNAWYRTRNGRMKPREGIASTKPAYSADTRPPYPYGTMPSVEDPMADIATQSTKQVQEPVADLEPVSSRSYYDDLLRDDIPDIDHWTVDDFKNADEVIDTMDRITDKITALEDYIADEADYDVVKEVRKKIAELNKDYEDAEEILKVFEDNAKTVEAPKKSSLPADYEQPESIESLRGQTYQSTNPNRAKVSVDEASDIKANPAEYKKVTEAVSNNDSASQIAKAKRSIEEKQRYLDDLKRRLNNGEISQGYYDTLSRKTTNEINALKYQVQNGGTAYQAPKAEAPKAPASASSDTESRIQALMDQVESLKKQLQGQAGDVAETAAKEVEAPKAEAPKTPKPQTDTSGLSDAAQKRVAELDERIDSLKLQRANKEITNDEYKALRREANQEKYAILNGKKQVAETPKVEAEAPKTEVSKVEDPKAEAPKAESKPKADNDRISELEAQKEQLKKRRANKELSNAEYNAERKKINQEIYRLDKEARKAEKASAPKAEAQPNPEVHTRNIESNKGKGKAKGKKPDTAVEMANLEDVAKEVEPAKTAEAPKTSESPKNNSQVDMPNVKDTAKEISDADAIKKAREEYKEAKANLNEAQAQLQEAQASARSTSIKEGGNSLSASQKFYAMAKKRADEAEQALRDLGVDPNATSTGKSMPKGKVKVTLNPTEAPDAGTLADGAKSADMMDNLEDASKALEGGELKKNSYSNETIHKTDLVNKNPEVAEHFIDNPQFYRAASNDAARKEADRIMKKPFDEAYNEFLELVSKKDPVSLPLGMRLAEVADKNTAVEIVSKMSSELTKAGQFTQAAAIEILNNNPLAAMAYTQKQLNNLNDLCIEKFKNFEKKYGKIELTEDEVAAFKSLKSGDKEALTALSEQISDRIAKQLPSTFGEKAKELRKLQMLLNPLTHARNVFSNIASIPLASASDRVEALLQNVWAKTGGKKSGFQVTQSLTGGSKELKKSIVDSKIVDKFMPQLENAGVQKWQEGLTSNDILNKRQIFKDSAVGTKAKEYTLKLANGKVVQKLKVSDTLDRLTHGKLKEILENLPDNIDEKMTGSIIENLRQADYWLLGAIEDDPFVKKRFVNRLASYLDAQGFKEFPDLAKLSEDELKAFDNATEVAWDEALKATFKDNNFMTKGLGQVKNALNTMSGGTLGEIIFPFVKTPANIAKRALEYSPFGLAEAVGKGLSGKGAEKVMNSISKSLTGSGLIALAYMLKKEGLITGNLSDNKDAAAFEKQQGKLPYAININGHGVTFDWLQPAGIPFIIGATIADATEESDKHWYDLAGDAAVAATDSWADISPLQSLKDLFKTDRSTGAVSLGRNLLDIALGTPESFLSSLGGAIARATDNTYRNTYSKADSSIVDVWNKALAKTPGASQTLPEQYTTWGDVRTRAESDGLNALQQFILPGKIGNDQSHPQDETISDLYDMTGNEAVFPHKAEWSYTINGETVKLTGKQQSLMQKSMGQMADKLAQQLIFKDSDYFKSLSYDDRAEALGTLMNFAEAYAKTSVLGYDITKSSSYKKLYDAYLSGGAKGVIDQLKLEDDLKQYGYDMGDKKAVAAAQEGNLEEFHEQDEALKSLGYNWGSDKAVEALEKGGIESLYDYDKTQQQMKKYGLSNQKTFDYLGSDYDDYAGLISKSTLHDTKKNAEIYKTYGADSFKMAGEADASGNKDGELTKAEVMRYWLSQGYSEAEINAMLQDMFGYAKATKRDWQKAKN